MNYNETISQSLLNHFEKYPLLETLDTFKFLYQSVFGCEHMISSPEFVVEYIKKEYETISDHEETFVPLHGNYARVNLDILNSGLSAETLGKLFFLTAKKEKGTLDDLKNAVITLKEHTKSGLTPFSEENLLGALKKWEDENYPPVHHSESFRQNYKPAYRVISTDYVNYLPLLCEIDKKAKSGNVVISIDGSSASGKSTLGNLLSSVYDCNLFHMDDFFLQPHQRTKERLDTPGGNIDSERFSKEILPSLNENKTARYHKFDCSKMQLGNEETVPFKKITIVEGAYSLHPDFKAYYDISVFLDISKELQKERILKRNPNMADRFFNEWIPMEHKYFNAFNIKEKCDFVIDVT